MPRSAGTSASFWRRRRAVEYSLVVASCPTLAASSNSPSRSTVTRKANPIAPMAVVVRPVTSATL